MEDNMTSSEANQEQQEDLPAMPPEKQMEAMGLVAEGEPMGTPAREQEDLPAMPPEKQMEAMGLVAEGEPMGTPAREQEDLPAMPPEKQMEAMGGQASQQPAEPLLDVEPELAAYQEAQASEQD
jgi:hypothetical protein